MGAQPPANLLSLATGLQLYWAGWEMTPEGEEECADSEAGGSSLTLPSKREENKNVEECINKNKNKNKKIGKAEDRKIDMESIFLRAGQGEGAHH